MRSGRVLRPTPAPSDDGTPVGINLAAGAVALTVAALIAAALPASQPGWRFTLIAGSVGGFATITLDQRALAGVVPLGWLIVNGFLEDRLGELSWHGSSDIWVIMVLVFSGALGLATGDTYRQIRDLRSRWCAEVERSLLAPDVNEQEARDA